MEPIPLPASTSGLNEGEDEWFGLSSPFSCDSHAHSVDPSPVSFPSHGHEQDPAAALQEDPQTMQGKHGTGTFKEKTARSVAAILREGDTGKRIEGMMALIDEVSRSIFVFI